MKLKYLNNHQDVTKVTRNLLRLLKSYYHWPNFWRFHELSNQKNVTPVIRMKKIRILEIFVIFDSQINYRKMINLPKWLVITRKIYEFFHARYFYTNTQIKPNLSCNFVHHLIYNLANYLTKNPTRKFAYIAAAAANSYKLGNSQLRGL